MLKMDNIGLAVPQDLAEGVVKKRIVILGLKRLRQGMIIYDADNADAPVGRVAGNILSGILSGILSNILSGIRCNILLILDRELGCLRRRSPRNDRDLMPAGLQRP